MNASLLKAEVTAAPGCRGTDDDVIDQVELKDFTGFENPAGEPQIGLGRGGIARYAAPIRRNKARTRRKVAGAATCSHRPLNSSYKNRSVTDSSRSRISQPDRRSDRLNIAITRICS